jgi:hypothetical protein
MTLEQTLSPERYPPDPVPLLHLPKNENQVQIVDIYDHQTGMKSTAFGKPASFEIQPCIDDSALPPKALNSKTRADETLQRLVEKGVLTQTEFEQYQKFADSAVRAEMLITGGQSDWMLANHAIVYFLSNDLPSLKDQISVDSNSPEDRVLQGMAAIEASMGDVPHPSSTPVYELIIRSNPVTGPIFLLYCIAKETMIGHKIASPGEDKELQYAQVFISKAVSALGSAEKPNDRYAPESHQVRAWQSRALVLLRDAHFNFLNPSLSQMANRAIGDITKIPDAGNRLYAGAHYPLCDEFCAELVTAAAAPQNVTDTQWRDSEDIGMVESSAKGWWGVVENFIADPKIVSSIQSLAEKYGLSHASITPDQYRLRMANVMIYADHFDNLLRLHPDDTEVQNLVSRFTKYAANVPDYSRMRFVVGNRKWQEALAVYQKKPENTFILFALTMDDGHTDAWKVPLSDLARYISEEVDVPDDMREVVNKIKESMAQAGITYDATGGDIRPIMAAWHKANSVDPEMHPFCSVFYQGNASWNQNVALEVQLAPHSYTHPQTGEIIEISRPNWTARGPYKHKQTPH